MPAQIQWEFKFLGLDSALLKLKEIEIVLSNITKLGGINGIANAFNNINNGGNNGTNFVPINNNPSGGERVIESAIGTRLGIRSSNTINDTKDAFLRFQKNQFGGKFQPISGSDVANAFKNQKDTFAPQNKDTDTESKKIDFNKLKAERDKELKLQTDINKIMEEHKKTLKALADLHANNKREIDQHRGGKLDVPGLNANVNKLKSNLDKKTEALLAGIGIKNGKSFVDNPYAYNYQENTDAINHQYMSKLVDAQKLRQKSYFNKPPVITTEQTPVSNIFSNLKNVFSKLISGLGAGGGGGRLGRIAVALFGPLGPIIGAVIAAFYALKFAIKFLIEGIEEGAKAYQHAAKLGSPVAGTFQQTAAFNAIGMESPDLSRLQGQFNKKAGRYEEPGTDVILGAARAGQLGNVQQLVNMSEEFKRNMADAAANSAEMAMSAKILSESSQLVSQVGREWHTLLAQIATIFTPIINLLLEGLKKWLSDLNLLSAVIIALFKHIGILSKDIGGNFNKIPGGNNSPSHVTAWEKIGFVFKGHEHTYQKDIANNTKETAMNLRYLITALNLKNANHTPIKTNPNLPH